MLNVSALSRVFPIYKDVFPIQKKKTVEDCTIDKNRRHARRKTCLPNPKKAVEDCTIYNNMCHARRKTKLTNIPFPILTFIAKNSSLVKTVYYF